MHDHRLAMVGAGIVTLLLSVVLFGTLPQSFFPPQNDDYSRVNITLPPGTHAQADRGGDRPASRRSCRRIRASSACSSAINVGKRPSEHRPQEGPQGHQHRVRARRCRRRSPPFPTPASASRARTAADPMRIRATSCSTLAVTIRCKLTAVANQIAKEMETRSGPSRAARRQPARAARNHHQAALRPRRRPRRDHRGAEPDDPHRDAWRHRAEQREILAVGPAGADHGFAVGECPPRHLDAREPAGADRRAAARCR